MEFIGVEMEGKGGGGLTYVGVVRFTSLGLLRLLLSLHATPERVLGVIDRTAGLGRDDGSPVHWDNRRCAWARAGGSACSGLQTRGVERHGDVLTDRGSLRDECLFGRQLGVRTAVVWSSRRKEAKGDEARVTRLLRVKKRGVPLDPYMVKTARRDHSDAIKA